MDERVAAMEPHGRRRPRDGVLRPGQLPRHSNSLRHKLYLSPAYVVCEEVMFPVISVCMSGNMSYQRVSPCDH